MNNAGETFYAPHYELCRIKTGGRAIQTERGTVDIGSRFHQTGHTKLNNNWTNVTVHALRATRSVYEHSALRTSGVLFRLYQLRSHLSASCVVSRHAIDTKYQVHKNTETHVAACLDFLN